VPSYQPLDNNEARLDAVANHRRNNGVRIGEQQSSFDKIYHERNANSNERFVPASATVVSVSATLGQFDLKQQYPSIDFCLGDKCVWQLGSEGRGLSHRDEPSAPLDNLPSPK